MSLPKLMLFVNGLATEAGIGSIFLNDLCACYPREKLCRYSTVRGKIKIAPEAHLWNGRPVGYFTVQVSALPILSSLTDISFRRRQESTLVERAVQFGRDNGVEAVWAVLNSTYIIRTALAVANRLNVPLYTTVWDPPELFRINMHLGAHCFDDIYRIFRETLQRSASVAVIGESMAAQYAHEFGISAIAMPHGHPMTASGPARRLLKGEPIRIGFAGGSIYAKQEWRALLRALESVEHRIGGRRTELHHVGRRPLRGVPMPNYVVKHGVLSPDETLNRLRSCDIGYVPYWFDRRYRRVAELSFPSKTAAYLAAGCRILYHGPKYGSPAAFLNKYEVGVACHSLAPEAIVKALEAVAWDGDAYSRYSDARRRVREELISTEAMVRQLSHFLGCRVDHQVEA